MNLATDAGVTCPGFALELAFFNLIEGQQCAIVCDDKCFFTGRVYAAPEKAGLESSSQFVFTATNGPVHVSLGLVTTSPSFSISTSVTAPGLVNAAFQGSTASSQGGWLSFSYPHPIPPSCFPVPGPRCEVCRADGSKCPVASARGMKIYLAQHGFAACAICPGC